MTRFLCAALCAAFLATGAQAAPLKEAKDWRYCSKDDQCVMIDAVCDKTAVNWQVKSKAMAFYAEQRKGETCGELPFWSQGEKMPRCYRGGCQVILKPKSATKNNEGATRERD
jgi:hypothetical protein